MKSPKIWQTLVFRVKVSNSLKEHWCFLGFWRCEWYLIHFFIDRQLFAVAVERSESKGVIRSVFESINLVSWRLFSFLLHNWTSSFILSAQWRLQLDIIFILINFVMQRRISCMLQIELTNDEITLSTLCLLSRVFNIILIIWITHSIAVVHKKSLLPFLYFSPLQPISRNHFYIIEGWIENYVNQKQIK